MTTLLWFRRDLRLADNPALAGAIAAEAPIVPVFIHAPGEAGAFPEGGASRWWLHRSVRALERELREVGSRLCIRAAGDSLAALHTLARESGARRVLWNRQYEPAALARDRAVKSALRAAGIEAESYNAALLHEPWAIATQARGPFQVFTPYWRYCRSLADPPEPLPAPKRLAAPSSWPESHSLESLGLEPKIPWASGLEAAWSVGSAAAGRTLERFLEHAYADYDAQRERPGRAGTSRLSPHLHFGEIGPRQIWHALRRAAARGGADRAWRESRFLAELGWREFAHHLLFHFPNTPDTPLRARFARFPWRPDARALEAWQRGATGYPIVDAGMRELWHTGWMHNRVRMIVGSFLVKDLLQPWTAGARWFWDTLVDADLASNTLGWQWVAGCGADAAPFFRIFNPMAQGMRFDPDGGYVRRWVPELARLPDAWLHQPWAAPAPVREAAGVILGSSYPERLIEHEAARREALRVLKGLGD